MSTAFDGTSIRLLHAEVCALRAQRDRLLAALELVRRGLASGTVKGQPLRG